MLTFKLLRINGVDVWKTLLTLMLTFKLLAINTVDLVDLYTRYISIRALSYPAFWNGYVQGIFDVFGPCFGDFIAKRYFNDYLAPAQFIRQLAGNSQMPPFGNNFDVFFSQSRHLEFHDEFVSLLSFMNQCDLLLMIGGVKLEGVNQVFATRRQEIIASAVIVIHRGAT